MGNQRQSMSSEAIGRTMNYRVTATLFALSALGVAPFVVHHARSDNTLLFVLILGTFAALAGGALFTLIRRHPGHSGKAVAALAGAAILATFAEVGPQTLYWVFPFTLINYYIFALRWALVINGLFLALFFPLAYAIVPPAHLGRVVANVLLNNLIAVVFSHTVQRKQAELSRLATRDPLTGLGNRRSLDFSLAHCVDHHQRNGIPAVVLVLDLDHFKSVNDTLGHSGGDDVLVQTAHCLANRLRRTDGLYRFGGEEFVALLTHTGKQEALRVAGELRSLVAQCDYPGGIALTVSVGLAELRDTDTAETWLGRADTALYKAKSGGRDRTEVGGEDGGDLPRAAGA